MLPLKRKIDFEFYKDLYKKRIKERKRIKGLFFSYSKDHKKNIEASLKFIDNKGSNKYIITEKNINDLMINYKKLKRNIFARDKKEKEIKHINERLKNVNDLTYTKLNDIFTQYMRNKYRRSSICTSLNKNNFDIDYTIPNSNKNTLHTVSSHYNKVKCKIDSGQFNNNAQYVKENAINHIIKLIKKSNKKRGIKPNTVKLNVNNNNYKENINKKNNEFREFVYYSPKSTPYKNSKKGSFLLSLSNKSNHNFELNKNNKIDNIEDIKQNNINEKKRKNFVSYTCKNLKFTNLDKLNTNEIKLHLMTSSEKKSSNSKINLNDIQNLKRLSSFKNDSETQKKLFSLFDIITTNNTNTSSDLRSYSINFTKTYNSPIKQKSISKNQNQPHCEEKSKNVFNLKKRVNSQKRVHRGSFLVIPNKVRYQPIYTANIKDFVDKYNRIKKENNMTELKCKENYFFSYEDISKIMKVREDLMMHLLKEKYFISQFPKPANGKLNQKEVFIKRFKESFDIFDNPYSKVANIDYSDLDE